MSNQNAGYRSQSPAVAFAANLGALKCNLRFYQERGELLQPDIHLLQCAAEFIEDAIAEIKKRKGNGP